MSQIQNIAKHAKKLGRTAFRENYPHYLSKSLLSEKDFTRILSDPQPKPFDCLKAIAGFSTVGDDVRSSLIFQHLKNSGFEVKSPLYSDMLKCYIVSGNLKDGEQLYQSALKENVELDSKFYSLLIELFSKCGKPENIPSIIKEMKNRKIPYTLHTYNALLFSFARLGDFTQVEAIFKEMKSQNIPPSFYSYENIILGCYHAKNLKKAQEYFALSIKNGFEPTEKSFNSLLDQVLRVEGTKGVLNLMEKYKTIKRTIHTYGILLKGYWIEKNDKEMESTFKVLRQNRLKPNLIIYNLMLRGNNQAGNFDRTLSLFEEMKSAKVEPDVNSLNEYLFAVLKKEGLIAANKALTNERIKPNAETKKLLK